MMRCLLLQGPVGPFFTTLQHTMEAQGWDVLRLCLDAGDSLFVDGKHKIWTGTRPWKPWLRKQIIEHKPDVIILFGCDRPAHIVARNMAKRRGIPLLSLEEGYIRPGFLSAEWGGNNHLSSLTTGIALTNTRPKPAAIKPGMRWMIGWSALYYTARALLSLPGQRTLHHRQYFWPAEVARWSLNITRRLITKHHDKVLLKQISDLDYDVIALQVPGDASLVNGGDGWTTERLIEESIQSLSEDAPESRHLVFKIHPLARGHAKDPGLIKNHAAAHNVLDRVHILYGGPLAPVLNKARGLITITSTSSLSAIEKRKTTLVLGKGITRREDLVWCGPNQNMIKKFWTAEPRASDQAINHFLSLLQETALIPGDAYQKKGQAPAAQAIAKKCAELFNHQHQTDPDPFS